MTEINAQNYPNVFKLLERINNTSDPERTLDVLSSAIAEPVLNKVHDAAQESGVAVGKIFSGLDNSCVY